MHMRINYSSYIQFVRFDVGNEFFCSIGFDCTSKGIIIQYRVDNDSFASF
jgi:hypothetical protein